jgi:Tol biopolymer transport system component/tetratricopeptide (TPR) repeat protein
VIEQKADGFFQAGGALEPSAPSYVARQADQELMQAVLASEYCNLLTARQMGKSSLMVRTVSRLRSQGVRTIAIDLTAIGTEVSAGEWYFGLVSQFSRQLGLPLDEVIWWNEHKQLGPLQRFSHFLRQIVLEEIQEPIVVFVDEIDSTLGLPFTDDFFATIRATYNARASDPVYKRLTFVLVGVARPLDLIKTRTRTPYNVGTTIDLRDFTAEEAQVLLTGLETVYQGQAERILERVLYWTDGHPYLTQKVCAEIVAEDRDWTDGHIDALVERLFLTEGSRKETNLQFVRDRIRESRERAEMLRLYRKVRANRGVVDEERSHIKSQLKLTGLVKAASSGELTVRNRIYAHVFDQQWIKENMPVSPRQWIAVAAAATAILAILVASYLFYREQIRPIEVRAELFTDSFLSATSPEVRLNNLAGLLRLKGYEDQALDLFFDLDANKQMEIFQGLGDPQQLGEDVFTVVNGVYQDQRLGNSVYHNQLLHAMSAVLHQVEGADVRGAKVTAMGIDYWVAGREQAIEGDFATAVEKYNLALGLNEENPAVLFDRALAYAALGEPEWALSDFEKVLNMDGSRQEDVRRVVISDPQLYAAVWSGEGAYQELAALLPTPANTPTSTITMTPVPSTPTPIPVRVTATPILPTITSTSTLHTDIAKPTASVTPTNTPLPTAPTPPATGRIALWYKREYNSTDFEVYVVNTDGSGLTNLTNHPAMDGGPDWSPDGKRIVFWSERDDTPEIYGREIYVMNADGSGVTRLTNNSRDDSDPTWSPDGNRIAFWSSRDGQHDIYVMNTDGSEITRLTNDPVWEYDLAWSPDGTRIAFTFSHADGNVEIYVQYVDGSGRTNLTKNPTWDGDPAWSPDSMKIAFASSRYGGFGSSHEIYVMNADGSDVTRLTDFPAGFPAWSPDGRLIAFISSRNGQTGIYVMNADGSGVTLLTNIEGYYIRDLTWSSR